MAPKKYQPVVVNQPEVVRPTTSRFDEAPAETVKVDHTERGEKTPAYGEQQSFNASVNYGGTSRAVNCTVNAVELQQGIRSQKDAFAKTIAENIEYQRVKRGQRIKRHKLPIEEEYTEEGETILKRKSTITKRREN